MNKFYDFTKWLLLAPEGSGGGEGGDGNSNSGQEGNNGSGDGNNGAQGSEKTFTQDQVNSMIAADKRKTTSSIYKGLGFESEEQAKEFIEKYKQQEENNKSDLAKAQEKTKQLEAEKNAEATKAQDLQYKFDAMAAGCGAEAAGDVVVLAKAKMSDGKEFADALKEVKEQYPAMFGQTDNSGGNSTGGGGVSPRKKVTSGDISGIGKRLAEQRKKTSTTKDDAFFK